MAGVEDGEGAGGGRRGKGGGTFFIHKAEEGAMGSEFAPRGVAFRQIGGDGVVARLRLYSNIALRLSHFNVFF